MYLAAAVVCTVDKTITGVHQMETYKYRFTVLYSCTVP
jgi:hypothetical protein